MDCARRFLVLAPEVDIGRGGSRGAHRRLVDLPAGETVDQPKGE